ncbi:MAG: DUF1826 domain-containing protein [Granulosicoccus sp.]
MNQVETIRERSQPAEVAQHYSNLRLSEGIEPTVLADIYDDNTHIAIWKRSLPQSLSDTVAEFIDANPTHKTSVVIAPQDAQTRLFDLFGHLTSREFCDDVATLVDMFCTLFELEQAGVRLSVLDNAMCPKFHVDRIPCRLITTYRGVATEWLQHEHVDRSKLGHQCNGVADHESGLFNSGQRIQQLNQGDVALLKGDVWRGNEGKGLVHRSPSTQDSRRLLLTLDMVS